MRCRIFRGHCERVIAGGEALDPNSVRAGAANRPPQRLLIWLWTDREHNLYVLSPDSGHSGKRN